MELSDEAIDKLLLLSTILFKDANGRSHYFIKGFHIYSVDKSTWALVGHAIYRSTLKEIAREAIKLHVEQT